MKLLVVSQFFPYPPTNGARQRAYQLITGLSRQHELHLVTFADAEDVSYLPDLRAICTIVEAVQRSKPRTGFASNLAALLSPSPRSVSLEFSPAMAATVARKVTDGGFDAALALTTKAGVYLRRHNLPKILDDDNVDSAYLARLVEFADGSVTKFRRKLSWVKGRRHEMSLVASFDAVTAVSEEDRQDIARIVPKTARSAAIEVVPNGVDLGLLGFKAGPVDQRTMVSTGALTYQANLDAAILFCRQILPRIRQSMPEARFLITGRFDGVDTSQLLGAELIGFVQDIRPIVAQSAAVVVPIRIGGGTRLKVLEAMALGAPVVSTSLGAAGLGLVHQQTALIADDPEGFAHWVLRLMREPELRQNISERAREYVSARFGWDRSVEAMNRVLESVARRESKG